MAIKRTITLNFKTSDGKTLPASFDVSDGESAFEVWKTPRECSQNRGTIFAEQKGADGKNGTNGADGKNGSNGAQGASIVSVSVQVKENP
ncbi:hypothetical protein J4727_16955 [Providencia rettgeri]|uniref:Collagen-like protein n=1 Tax=Providencia rettgeri TaxID=587 RepID=A0A939SRM9_PRORE|nr:hypothetical protein [Providencia rettgeri]